MKFFFHKMKAANIFFLNLKILFPRVETLIHELVDTFTASDASWRLA